MTSASLTLDTWDVPSRFVDPNRVVLNPPPPGCPPRAPALKAGIVLPRGYDGERRFPALYLLHGHGDTYDTWAHPDIGNILELARDLEAVIVLPEGARGWYVDWWNGGTNTPGWARYHLDELVPLVESRLALREGRRWRAIAGLSMGGGGAMYYAARRPDYFGTAVSFSGTLDHCLPDFPGHVDSQGEPHEDVFGPPGSEAWTARDPAALVGNLRETRLYVAHGDGEPMDPSLPDNPLGAAIERAMLQYSVGFAEAAEQAGADVTLVLGRGRHEWATWRRNLLDVFDWGLFEPAAVASG